MRNILAWIIVAVLVAANVVSCTTPYEGDEPTPVEFATIAKGDQSAVTGSDSVVISDVATWEATWDGLVAHLLQRPPPPEIDFGDYILLAHFMGQRPTSGYEVEFTEVLEGDKISATVTEISPGSNCTLLQVITAPYLVIQIPKTDKEVQFTVQQESRSCKTAAWYDWPMYHHDAQHSGGATGRGIITTDGNLQFSFDTRSQAGGDPDGFIDASPVVANDGTIYVAVASASSGEGTVYALDSSGSLKTGWPFSIGAEIHATPAIGPDNTIYLCTHVTSTGDNFFALNPSGTIKWKLKVPGASAVNFSVFSSPAVVTEWVAEKTSSSSPPWGFISTLRQAIYVGASDGYLYKIIDGGSSGRIAWGIQLSYTANTWLGISSPAVGPSGTIYVGILDPTVESGGHWGKLAALNPDGSERWRIALTTTNYITTEGVYEEVCSPTVAVVHYPYYFHNMPSGDYETVFAGTTDYRMKAVRENPITRQPSLDMDFGASGGIRTGCPAIIDLNGDGWVEVIFGTAFTLSNNVYAVSFTQGTGIASAFCEEYWHFSTGLNWLSGPAVAFAPNLQPIVFIGSMDPVASGNSKIYSINWDGTIIGTYDLAAPDCVWSSPAVAQGPTPTNLLGAAGWVFVCSILGKLYAFGPPY
jgi:hypothetical protein